MIDLIRKSDADAAIVACKGNGATRQACRDAIAALPAVTVGVEPLVWEEGKFCGQDAFYADTPFGVWSVICYSDRGFRWTSVDTSGDNSDQDWTTADEAKSEAQAEYESRILDAIEHDVAKKLQPLAWDVDGRRLHMDDTMSFSKSYDWDGYECFRQEGYGLGASYIIWPDSITSKTWNLYGTADGLFVTDLNGADAAKAAAQADYEARILAALEPVAALTSNHVDDSQTHDPAVNAPDPAAIREAIWSAFIAGCGQGSDEATSFEWGSTAQQTRQQAFDDFMAEWNKDSAPLRALISKGAAEPTEYERKVAQMKKDFPNGI